MPGDKAHAFAIPTEDIAEIGFANACSLGQHRFEHELKIAGRTGNDLEHIRRGGLLLKESASSRVRCCSASNKRTFSIAITAWSANALTRAACLSSNAFASRCAVPMAPMTSSARSIGAKIIELYPKSRAFRSVAAGVATLPITGVNRTTRFESIVRPAKVL